MEISDDLKTIFKLVKEYPNNYELGKQIRNWVDNIKEQIALEEWK